MDQENSADLTISALIGENSTTEYDETVSIPPPKGLSSINMLPVNSANFTSTSGSFSDLVMNIMIPDFDFLPLDIAAIGNQGLVHYTNSSYNRVFISGTTSILETIYLSQFVKDYGRNTYTITLVGASDTELPFSTISNVFFPTIAMGTSNVLTSNQYSLDILSRFGITEEDTTLTNVVIIIEFSPFLMYTVRGTYQSPDPTPLPISVYGNFANLDGSILSFVDFGFSEYGSRRAFDV